MGTEAAAGFVSEQTLLSHKRAMRVCEGKDDVERSIFWDGYMYSTSRKVYGKLQRRRGMTARVAVDLR
jgi:hypothetical protein